MTGQIFALPEGALEHLVEPVRRMALAASDRRAARLKVVDQARSLLQRYSDRSPEVRELCSLVVSLAEAE